MAVYHKVDSIKQIKEREELEVRIAKTPDEVDGVNESITNIEEALLELTEIFAG